MKRDWVAAMAPLALLLAASPAAADETDFWACDGFKAPTATSDGTQTSWESYTFTSVAVEADEKAAAASCTAALADPLLQPQFVLRRFLLLRAKALHLMAVKQGEEALAALDQADEALARLEGLAPSYRTGNAVLRIDAEYLAGHPEAARAQAAALEKAHPYTAQVMHAVQAIRITLDPDPAAVRSAMLARVPADPAVLKELFWLAIYYGDYPEALRLGPQVGFDLPSGRGDSHIDGLKDHQYDVIELRADYDGATAYALAAAGQGDAAQAAIAKARKEVADASQTAATPPRDQRERTDRDLRVDAGRTAAAKLDKWEAAIALRGQAPGMTGDAFLEAMKAKDLRSLPVTAELLGRLKPASPVEQAALHRAIETLNARRDGELRSLDTLDIHALAVALPRPGVTVPQFRFAGDGLLIDDANGFYSKRESGSPYVNVRYGDTKAPKWTVEDLTLLAAATYARRSGKDSFLIDSRMIVDRSIRMIDYRGRHTSTISNGAELRYRILPVNAAELPPELEGSRWRLIRVQAVLNELAPIYAAASQAKH